MVTNLNCRQYSFFEYIDDLQNKYAYIRLPLKGVALLFKWLERAPFAYETQAFIAMQRRVVKTTDSTFGLPNFIIKQIKFYQSCTQLAKQRNIDRIKKVVRSALGLTVSAIKMPLLLDKTDVIDLSKISRRLPSDLDLAGSLLTMILSGSKLIENSWSMASYLAKPGATLLSRKGGKLAFGLGTTGIEFATASFGAAALLLNLYIPSFVLILLATASFAASLFNKLFLCQNPFDKESNSSAYKLRLHSIVIIN